MASRQKSVKPFTFSQVEMIATTDDKALLSMVYKAPLDQVPPK